jgi:hypothetical protein
VVRRWLTAVTGLSKPLSGVRYILGFTPGEYQLMVVNNNIDGASNVPQSGRKIIISPSLFNAPAIPQIGSKSGLLNKLL